MVGQKDIGKYLDMCTSSDALAIEEVLHAYIISKLIRGASPSRVLNKLYHLSLYLRVTGRSHILHAGKHIFAQAQATLSGSSNTSTTIGIGISPPTTQPGKLIWNHIRRSSSSSKFMAGTDMFSGIPSTGRFSQHERLIRTTSTIVRPPELDTNGIEVPRYTRTARDGERRGEEADLAEEEGVLRERGLYENENEQDVPGYNDESRADVPGYDEVLRMDSLSLEL